MELQRANKALLDFLERGNQLLHEHYSSARVGSQSFAFDHPYSLKALGRSDGLYAGIIWLEGAISLLEVESVR